MAKGKGFLFPSCFDRCRISTVLSSSVRQKTSLWSKENISIIYLAQLSERRARVFTTERDGDERRALAEPRKEEQKHEPVSHPEHNTKKIPSLSPARSCAIRPIYQRCLSASVPSHELDHPCYEVTEGGQVGGQDARVGWQSLSVLC